LLIQFRKNTFVPVELPKNSPDCLTLSPNGDDVLGDSELFALVPLLVSLSGPDFIPRLQLEGDVESFMDWDCCTEWCRGWWWCWWPEWGAWGWEWASRWDTMEDWLWLWLLLGSIDPPPLLLLLGALLDPESLRLLLLLLLWLLLLWLLAWEWLWWDGGLKCWRADEWLWCPRMNGKWVVVQEVVDFCVYHKGSDKNIKTVSNNRGREREKERRKWAQEFLLPQS